MHSVSSFLKSPNFIGEGISFNAVIYVVSFHANLRFYCILDRFMGYYLWFIGAKVHNFLEEQGSGGDFFS